MKRITLRSTALSVLFSIGLGLAVQAQSSINIVTTAVPFLRISPDARAGGMGDAGIATTPDANAVFWNRAKLPFANYSGGVSATYTPWLKDIAQDVYLTTLGGYYKIDEESAISGGLRYFSLGNIQFTDYSGNPISTGRPREFSLDFGYSRKISDKLGVGVALRYINSSLANGYSNNGVTYKAGNALAADLSLYGNNLDENGQGLTYGLAISNLGSKIGYTTDAKAKDFIPANLGAGVAYTWAFEELHKFTLALDINHLLVPAFPEYTGDTLIDGPAIDEYRNQSVLTSWTKSFGNKANTASVGAEYTYNDQFSLRAGYFLQPKSQGGQSYFTAGVGLKYNVFGFNFSYLAPSGNGVTRNALSNTIRFSVIFDLGEAAE
ncbi:type IX secretion system outer membrane channel protein PorV [Panacibacter ginsenosidivorans]|uniref:Type IX secretion system outer membrane channel protein PorV n=1 Tax=Panacibacter ginsenosidivorans TaxID=1813871 RepID=A0A5B8V7S7_9BACT|nr:type IX secretion system outer membrane channel protein PorV [Panacibacter ginsenosidivorans]QEC67547.1 type IX secretion system outer membrane channel protein PorV [Panacibacter ginsenosidivorans]